MSKLLANCVIRSKSRLIHKFLGYSTKEASQTKWRSVVGLEVHAQIRSQSKLFSAAGVEFGAPVNERVALLDASIPGTLPVLNEKCVEAGIKTALALSCDISSVSMFDRKHYFYADLPVGYQITQQRAPLAKSGALQFPVFIPGVTKKPYYKTSRLHQLQLEQDSGKSLHDTYDGRSLVDLNRAGVPLMELVFEPDLNSGEEAAALVKELILILSRLDTCSCKMEEGALRVDANISIHKPDEPLGTRTEVKNIGSVRGVAQAITYEIQRQIEIKNKGGKIYNETRAWDAATKTTIAMRDKEVVQDYRFMPEPNLPPLHINVNGDADSTANSLLNVPKLQQSLPELPAQTRQNLIQEHNLSPEIGIILVNEQSLLNCFTEILENNPKRQAKIVSNFLINELLSFCNKNKLDIDEFDFKTQHLGELIDMLEEESINLHLARLILEKMYELKSMNKSPQQIAEENNWKQISDVKELQKICEDTLIKQAKLVEQYKKGKTKLFFAIVGEIARSTEQRANMAKVVEILKDLLKK